jgi:hypothetical protein
MTDLANWRAPRAGDVLGTRTVTRPGGWLLAESVQMFDQDQANAAFYEGFCPACLVPLAGDVRNWCPQCRASWNLMGGG